MERQHKGSRRLFVKGAAGLGGGLAAASFASMLSSSQAFAQAEGDSPQTIFNLAATVETFAVTHLINLLTRRTFELSPAEELQSRVLLGAEQAHLDLAIANGGTPATTQFFFPPELYTNRERFATTTAQIETACTAAYLAASRRFAELGDPRLAATQGQLACSEAQHIAVARDLLGVVPSDIAWALPLFYNVSDSAPVIAPFLTSNGEYTLASQYPGAQRVSELLGAGRDVLIVPPTYTQTF